ncbi:MAG: hypothetical protein JXB04_08075 [Kiritimatiellae bacterium]|nr:hypothetical protein [Kiritimatiellia bacterium]
MSELAEIEKLIRRIEADGKVTREEIEELNGLLIRDQKMTSDERMLLEGLFAKIRRGEVKEM